MFAINPVEPGNFQPSTKQVESQLLDTTIVDPITGWYAIVEVPLISQSSLRISNL